MLEFTNPKLGGKPKRNKQRSITGHYMIGGYSYGWYGFLWCIGIIWGLTITVVAIVALVFASDTFWIRDEVTDNIISRNSNADVEIRAGNNFIIHDKLLHSGTNVMAEKISFTPVLPIGPTGDDLVFGDQGVTYSRLQAGLAIGFRLGTNSFLTPPGILLGEPDLKVLIEPFGVHIASILIPFFGIFIPSDERIKTNITDMNVTEAMVNIMSLRPRTYYYTDTWHEMLGEETVESRGEKRRGFIAQEVENVLPHSVKQTSLNLDGKIVDDFRDLRKEDLITETVSALQLIFYQSICELGYNTLGFDSFDRISNQTNNTKRSPQIWARAMQDCLMLNADGLSNNAKCICLLRNEFCNNREIRLCAASHPLEQRCNLLNQLNI